MNLENIDAEKKKNIIKIGVPILIILMVISIWLFKDAQKEPVAAVSDNPDFSLFVTEAIDLEKLKSYGVPIIIDFGADSCQPCKEMAPVLLKLNKDLQGKAIVKFVDVWKYQELAAGYPITIIPTQLFFDKDGKPYAPSDPEAAQMNRYVSQDTNEHVFTTHEGGMTEEMMRTTLKEMGME